MKIGFVQLTSKLDFEANLTKLRHFLALAKNQGLKYIFLPECFYSMSDGTTATPHLVSFENEHFKNIQSLAKDYSVYLLGGSVAFSEAGRVLNRCLNFSPDGELLGFYDKIHLFSCDLQAGASKKIINESDIYTCGKLPQMIQVGPLKVGLSICFDLRYPEMFRNYVLNGANILSISAAFTVPTGKAHWHTLLRARAIENQCFVVAPAQYGRHNERVQTFGHSLIIDPWGDILVDAGEGEKLLWHDIDLDKITQVRSAVKVF